MAENNRIFVLSLHRTGTQSTQQFLLDAGINSLHTPTGRSNLSYYFNARRNWSGRETDLGFIFEHMMKNIAEDYEAVIDDIGVLYEEAYKQYPDAKFILVFREPEAWAKSVRKHIDERELVASERVQYWKYLTEKPETITDVPNERLAEMCSNHKTQVEAFFEARPEADFVSADLNDSALGQKLSRFLGIEERPMPFADKRKNPLFDLAATVLDKLKL